MLDALSPSFSLINDRITRMVSGSGMWMKISEGCPTPTSYHQRIKKTSSTVMRRLYGKVNSKGYEGQTSKAVVSITWPPIVGS
jgi:hypothetical protein